MESEEKEFLLGQIMYLLGTEDKYSAKLYHYIDDMGIESVPCSASEIDLKELNKAEFGLLKRIEFEDLILRNLIEEEIERRSYADKRNRGNQAVA
jgi:hypothetical protein